MICFTFVYFLRMYRKLSCVQALRLQVLMSGYKIKAENIGKSIMPGQPPRSVLYLKNTGLLREEDVRYPQLQKAPQQSIN